MTMAVLKETGRARKAAMMQSLAQQFRIAVLDILHEKQTGHWGGASSAAELLMALYFDAMNIRPERAGLAGPRPAGGQQGPRLLHALHRAGAPRLFSRSRS